MGQTTEREGLILQSREYRENDALLTFCTPDTVMTILARGVLKNTSKNLRICQPFSKVHLFLDEKWNRSIPLVLHGHCLSYYYRIPQDLIVSGVCNVLCDCLLHSRTTQSIYTWLEHCFQAFQDNDLQAYGYACLVLKELLVQEGIAPFVDGCVLCQRKDRLITLSMPDGGFLCQTCNHERYPARYKKELIQIHSLFKVQKEDVPKFLSMYEFTLDDILYWASWFEKYMNLSLPSLSFLRSVRTL